MTFFRCHFIRGDGHIHAVKVLECLNDRDAIRQARTAFEDQEHPMFELYEGARRVCGEDKPTY
jgi:hypothetical protein